MSKAIGYIDIRVEFRPVDEAPQRFVCHKTLSTSPMVSVNERVQYHALKAWTEILADYLYLLRKDDEKSGSG